MDIQLTDVLTDVIGMNGQAIIRAIVAGERDPQALAMYDDIGLRLTECDAKLESLLQLQATVQVDLGKPSRAGRRRGPHLTHVSDQPTGPVWT